MAYGFNFGSLFGGGPNAAEELSDNGADQSLAQVPTAAQSVNTNASQPYTAAQLSLLSQLGQEANGTGGPTQAQSQLQSGLAQNLASQKAAVAGSRGDNQNMGLVNQQIANGAADANASTAGQAAGLRAQETATAQGQLGNLANTGAQQQQQVAEANANLANSQYQTQAQNTLAQNQAAATMTGAGQAQNQSLSSDAFVPSFLAEGGVVDPEWESHVIPISGPGTNTFNVSAGVGSAPGIGPIQNPPSKKANQNLGKQIADMFKKGKSDDFKSKDIGKHKNDPSDADMAGGGGYQSSTFDAPAAIPTDADMAGYPGSSPFDTSGPNGGYQSSTQYAPAAVPSDSDMAGYPGINGASEDIGNYESNPGMGIDDDSVDVSAMADGGVIDGDGDENPDPIGAPGPDDSASTPADTDSQDMPNVNTSNPNSPPGKSGSGAASKASGLISLIALMAKGGTVAPDRPPAGRDPASLQAYPASRPEPGRDPASLKQYPPSDAMHPGSMDLSQPQYVSVTSGSSTSGYPTAEASGEVLKGPKVVIAGEAGPEAFVPLRKDYTPDPNRAKGPGMAQFLAALKANGYKDPNEPDSVFSTGPDGKQTIHPLKVAKALATAGAAHESRIANLEQALNALSKKKRKK